MPTYRFQAYTAAGQSRRGRREAPTAKALREQLLAEGLYPRELHAVGGGSRLSAAQRALLYRELAALLDAGIPLDRSLQLLAEGAAVEAAAEPLARVRDEVREGRRLSQALKESAMGIRGDEEAVLLAGESSGTLAKVCVSLADLLERESEVGEQLKSALTYPLLVCVLAGGVLALVVGFLLPVYEKLLGGLGKDLPLLTEAVLSFGRALRHPLGFTLAMLPLAGLAWLIWKLIREPEQILPRKRFSLPFLGGLFAAMSRARFARTLSLLLEGGVRLPEAVEISGRATGSPWLTDLANALAERIRQGARIGEGLQDVPVLGTELSGWMKAGEQTGTLHELLLHAARAEERAWDRGVKRSLSLIEPLLIVGVGVMILVVALAILLPMLRINSQLSS